MPEMPDAKTMAEITAEADEAFETFLRPSLAGVKGLITYKVTFISALEEDLFYFKEGDKCPWGYDELVMEAVDTQHVIDKMEYLAAKEDSAVSIYSIKRLTPPQLYPPEDLN